MFVVDGDWTTDPTAPSEKDSGNNVNNVLTPENIKKPTGESAFGAAAMSGVTADSTTAKLAGEVPKESEKNASPPGAFPETPANEVKDFSVKPIPASEGLGNPVKLAPGEKVPDHSEVTPHTVDSKVTTSKEDYEKDASASLTTGATGTAGAGAGAGDSAFSVPEKSKNLIPESSLPINDSAKDTTDSGPHISSVAPQSTTAGLAAAVPKEPRREATVEGQDAPTDAVPEVVKESISEAHQAPEAAASPEAVAEKKEVESELLKDVKKTDAAGEPAPASAETAAQASTAPAPTGSSNEAKGSDATDAKPSDGKIPSQALEPEPEGRKREPSRDLSPMSKDPNAPANPPVLDTKTPRKPEQKNGANEADSPGAKKKKNRASGFFGKLKEKFK
ncbi:MAG: hypothetical protein Q9160_001227 [Pyrenula sp. 1 TL-2023]